MPRRRAPPVSPERHPFPPPDLDSRPLPIAENRGPWWRSYYPTTRGGQPWGPLRLARTRSNRFDSPTYRYGVLYAAENLDGALIETFGRNLTSRLLHLADLEARHLALVHASRSLRLVDLTGRGLAGLGADSRLWAGDDYEYWDVERKRYPQYEHTADRWAEVWPGITTRLRAAAEARRRAGWHIHHPTPTAVSSADPPAPPLPPKAELPAAPAAPSTPRATLVINGRPTVFHPWKRRLCLTDAPRSHASRP